MNQEELIRRLNTIMEGIAEGVVVLGLDKEVLFVNRAAKEIFGKAADESNSISTLADLIESTIKTGKYISNREVTIGKSDKKITLRINTSLMKESNGEVSAGIGIFRDVSLIKELKEELKGKYSFRNIVGKNAKMRKIYELLREVSSTSSTVLIEGETGTGKELIASAIHHNSPFNDKPFVKVHCAALSEGLLESELFGHVKGSFTGAIADKPGRFELANGGTLFLDEVGDIPLTTQVKLLRVLQDGQFERVGGTKTIKVNVRIVAATNKDLKEAVKNGQFREDFYYRLKVVPITVPPLRERKDDIPILIKHFITKFNKEMKKRVISVSPEAMGFLLDYDYAGNIRELEHIIEHAFVRCRGTSIHPEHLPGDLKSANVIDKAMASKEPLKELEKETILRILNETEWKYQDCAKRLGVSRTTLWRKMKELRIERR